MSDDRTSQEPAGERSQLVEEAATWCSRMNGPDADRHLQEFGRWLALGAVHRQVYSEISELYGYGGTLRGRDIHRDPVVPPPPPDTARVGRRWFGPVLAAGLVGVAAYAGLHIGQPAGRSPVATASRKADATPAQLETALGRPQTFALADGSIVTLDTDSLVTVRFDRDRRELRLEHGRARFEVSHERRPFVVDAGRGSVIAHGTIFDVRIAADRTVHVHLFRGAIDVRASGWGAAGRRPVVTKLVPGGSAAYGDRGPIPASARADAPAPDWPSGLIPFDRTPLSDVLEQANRYSVLKITLADPALGRRPVSGTLRIADIRGLAETLAHHLQLRTSETRDGVVLALP